MTKFDVLFREAKIALSNPLPNRALPNNRRVKTNVNAKVLLRFERGEMVRMWNREVHEA